MQDLQTDSMTGSEFINDHAEGKIARTIETQTAKLPSDLFLWAAGLSVLGSLSLQLAGMKDRSIFVGQWVPSFLLLGVYNKIVKVSGSDRTSSNESYRHRVVH